MNKDNKQYANLHIHSHYSNLDGYGTVKEYIEAASHYGLPGLGLSDHGNASGLYEFITESQKAGIIPVPGVEFYMAPENPDGAKSQSQIYYGKGGKKAPQYDVSNGAYTHLTVFARNNVGLSNLFKLTSMSWEPENFYFKPRIDTNMLAEHSEGLIVTTGCPSSEVNRRFLLDQDDKAYEYAGRLKSIFGDNLYIEVMNHRMENEELETKLLPKQIRLSKDLGIKMIGTNDSHYAFKSDAETHERLLALSTKSKMKELPFYKGGKRFAFSTEDYYIKSYDEMLELYPDDIAEELLDNTIELMNKCKDIKLEYDPHLRPEIDIPEGFTPATYLQKIIFDGFKVKRGHEPQDIQAESIRRIQEEFEVLHSNDFMSYFLVVHDYISYAHEQDIGVGAGRGCFVPGSKVRVNQGAYRNIEDIKHGDKVQTHDTTYQTVEDTFIYDVIDEDMVKVKLSNGKEINATSDHLIFHKDKGFIKVEDFVVGDVMLGAKEKTDVSEISITDNICKDNSKSGYFTSYQQDEKQIYYDSIYELKALTNLETDSKVLEFERCKRRVSYIKPSTGLEHNYLPDIEVTNRDGSITVIGVKDKCVYESDIDTKSKLEQAKVYFDSIDIDFVVWTQDTFKKLNYYCHNDITVESIEHYDYTGEVYDLQVENVHNYNIEGVTVHNSVGGSEIAYVMDISNTDPIRFDLLFERFLSPGRGSLYQIDYVSGESEEIAVSAKKRVQYDDGDEKVIYVHELYPGDTVNYGNKNLVIKDVYVKQPGSAPDVDTDFHTEGREQVVQYCVDKYGEENVSNIITFGTFKAKSSFKDVCSIYDVPYSMANKVSALIPGIAGDETSLAEIMDPDSDKYREGEEFREAIDTPMFDSVVEVASALDGRVKNTGVHPCGVIISREPLAGIIPTQVRQDDGKIISQWKYPELEALGLIKMDLLGLELIDTVQQTLANIKLTNESAVKDEYIREIPDMRELILGPMDDKETFKTLQEGNTVGIFQLGSPGVRDLLKKAKPATFMEIANITALYRPGPMKSGAPTQYADRKSGKESVSYIHKDFEGTEVQEVLEETFGLLIFQEQIMLIAGRYAGLLPYETDQLRSAIGKKKMGIMMEMKPKFIDGCLAKGASQEAANILWETIEVFGQYGFNKSHSVSYAINIYETVFLKTHYPNEFMSALIQQGFGKPERVREYIQEAIRMGLKIGTVDINTSQVQMASTGVNPENEYDIVFGFSGVSRINDELSHAIVSERNKNGLYKSVADFVTRVSKSVPLTASPLYNLGLAGAFDCFDISRKQLFDKAKMFIDADKLKESQGVSLFDIVPNTTLNKSVSSSIDIHGEDYWYNELIKKEAETLGMFVSGHPTDKLGHIARVYHPIDLKDILSSGGSRETFTVLGTFTNLESKTNRAGNKSISLLVDDGTATAMTYLPKEMVESIEKAEEIARINKAKNDGKVYKMTKRAEKLAEIVNDDKVIPMEPIKKYAPYMMKIKTRGWGPSLKIVINEIVELDTAPDGTLPYEVNVPNSSMVSELKKVVSKHKDDNGSYIKVNLNDNNSLLLDKRVKLSLDFIMDMESVVGKDNIVTSDI